MKSSEVAACETAELDSSDDDPRAEAPASATAETLGKENPRPKVAAGDDLEADFEGEIDIDDDDVAMSLADKKRRLKRLKANKKRRQQRAGT